MFTQRHHKGILAVLTILGLFLLLAATAPTATAADAAQTTTCTYYTVRRGDTLLSLSRRFGVTAGAIARANKISNPNRILIGQRLCIPTAPPPPAPAPTPTPAPSANPWTPPAQAIEVFSPVAQAVYHSPLDVNGFSVTFEGTVNLRLLDAAGEVLAERLAMGGGVEHAFFHTYLRFEVEEEQAGMLEVFEISMQDGAEINKVQIPLVLLPGQRFVDLLQPAVGADLCGPILASGYSNTFEANVVLELRQRDGALVAQVPTTGGAYGYYRDFSDTLNLGASAPQALLVTAYESSPRDGMPIDQSVTPITLWPPNSAKCSQ